MRSDQTNVDRFIYLYMIRFTPNRFQRNETAVMGTDLDAYLRKFIVFLSQAFGCVNFMADN